MALRTLPKIYTSPEALSFASGHASKNTHSSSVRRIIHRVAEVALTILKTSGAVLGLVTAGLLLGICEGIYQLYAWGNHSLTGEILERLMAPALWFPFYKGDLKERAHKVTLQSEKCKTRLQAYHLPSLPFQRKKSLPKRLIVIFNPNSKGWQGSFHRMVVRDHYQFNPCEELEFLFFDYRGVSRSKGKRTSLDSIMEESDLAAKYAQQWAQDQGLSMSSVTFSGYSLGGGGACHVAKKFPEAELRLNCTFKSYSKAILGGFQKQAGISLSWLLSPFLSLMGRACLSPEVDLVEREEVARSRGLTPGKVHVISSLDDSVFGPFTTLVIPPKCLEGEFADLYDIGFVSRGHMAFFNHDVLENDYS